ncbi:WRT-10 protein [Loa loa]|uniref:WRT-10 protein n=1 Tax=Loa loa TaxID=7209 RepID=A0A1S0TRJ1_LOALO|nr:WRT-10 protein [Loa loa]EFO18798.1 WRT-10 protein [Loa loa]
MSHISIYQLFYLLLLSTAFEANSDHLQPTLGIKCLPNQVVTKLTVYEDGAIEAECNKLPCGVSGVHCNDNQTNCRAETDTLSGMKWASNGQSILQRCCIISVPRKLYIGTDLVSVGSYYTGGTVDLKDLYSREGPEFDFVSNVRTEQGGVRVWVYRIVCPKANGISGWSTATPQTQERAAMQKQASNNGNAQSGGIVAGDVPTAHKPINPLQYRPPNWRMLQRDLPIGVNSKDLFERLI